MAAEEKGDGGNKKMSKQDQSRDRGEPEEVEEEEPDFSDPEDYVDDVSDQELVGDLLKKRPKETDGIDSVIVVDNVPSVGSERLEKLQNVIRKIFSKFGKVQTEHYPLNDEQKTKGYIFLEYQNPQDAAEAVKATNGYKLDKQHTFSVNLFSDFDKYQKITEEWEEPQVQPYVDHGNLRAWLTNPHCYDQFSVIYEGGEKTGIFFNSHGEPTVVEERQRWTETYVRWSPQGNFLATFHYKGIALWGGENFRQIMKFSHQGVQLIDFSPCERYMVTFSPMPDNRDDPQAIIIWDIRTGQKKRGFHCENASVWPIFKWNHDGSYFARMSLDTLSIYTTPSFGLLDKKSIKIVGLKDFSWSPTDNMISYWTPEDGDMPARVTLIDIPGRETLCVKNLFTVADCKMHWQKSGDHLCVKVDRYKSKKEEKDQVRYGGIFHNFNIFRLREKQIPVDIVEVKESILAFAWEPVNTKFAIIHGESPRISVSFYLVKKGQGSNVELIKTFDKRPVNSLFWSPRGQFICLAGLRSMNGTLEFVDTTDMLIMTQAEHFMATDVEWDPTGRYVATAVSWWGHKVDNAYWLWNFQGRLLHKQSMERFCQLLWRPRPASLLSIAQQKEIKKNMKKYNQRFSLEDKMRDSKASKEQIERRRKMIEDWENWQAMILEAYSEEKEQRLALRGGIDTDEIDSHIENFEEEVIEFLVSVQETIVEE